MTSEPPDAREITAFRESLYRFFSDCLLRPPQDSAAAAWRDPEWRAALLRLLDLPPSALPPDLELGDGEMLAAEHARLFLVPATQTCPFESYHRTPRPVTEEGVVAFGPLPGKATIAVHKTYGSWGLRPEQETEEVPDHAATELRFMAMLVGIEGQIRTGEDDGQLNAVLSAQADFLDQHILAWFPVWTATVQARARLPFYRTLVHLLVRFLQTDRHTLELLVALAP